MKNKIIKTCIAATLLGLSSVSAQAATISLITIDTPLDDMIVGLLSFTRIEAGVSLVTMSDNDLPAGSWFNTDGDPIVMNYNSISIGEGIIGETVTFNMYLDAADVGGILAGGLDLFYDDTVLTYNGDFDFDTSFDTDPLFSLWGDDCATTPAALGCSVTGEINGIAFGNFDGIDVPVPEVPVPAAAWLMLSGLGLLGGLARRKANA